jgi:hypothetical protein
LHRGRQFIGDGDRLCLGTDHMPADFILCDSVAGRFGHDIGFGIGIAHGFATLGTIGFEGRFDYAAIGTVSKPAELFASAAMISDSFRAV